MEKQKIFKPWIARFKLYRKIKGGIWYKYYYNVNFEKGWYWINKKLDNKAKTLTLLKKEEWRAKK